MPERNKPLWRRFIEFRLLFVVNVIVVAAIGFSFGREWVRNREIQGEIAMLQEQAAALQTRNLEIADLNNAFRTESFIEREARLKLGLKKPGESTVVIQDGSPVGTPTSAEDAEAIARAADPRTLLATESSETEVANPLKWWHYFLR